MKMKAGEILTLIVWGPPVLALIVLFLALPFVLYKEEGWLGVIGWIWSILFVAWLFVSICEQDSLDP